MDKRRRDGKKTWGNYSLLKRKIFWQMAALVLASVLGLWFLYAFFWMGKIADPMVALFQRLFGLSYQGALDLYQRLIRNHMSLIMGVASALCFFVLFYFFLNWFTRYFKEINEGIDALIPGGALRRFDGEEYKAPNEHTLSQEIRLSKEMEPMEKKLNFVRNTLKQQFEEIKAAEEKKDELIMYLAHDIRTPLTSVIGYLSVMEEMPDLTEEQRKKFLQITLAKAKRLEELVEEFFDITRYGSQSFHASKQPVDLYYMLSQLAEEVYPVLEEKKKRLVIDADESLVVYGDGDKLARIFQNLLKNAIAYGKENSTVTIKAWETHEKTMIRFSNEGETIPEEKLKHVFDKFYRMDEARQSEKGGAGLGLAIAKELALLHKGTILAESRSGVTSFTVVLPKNGMDKDS